MWGIFKKRGTWEKIDRYIKRAFDRVKNDIHHVYSWINYLKHKDEVNDHEHSKFNREIGENRMAIHYLSSTIQELTKELDALKQGNVPKKRTSQGQLKDMSKTFKGQLEDIKGTTEDTQIIAKKQDLTGSQLELVQLLYHSDRPLGYGEIAIRLQKKPKSIRNLIYEIRDKGLLINDKPIGIRSKGFYLDEGLKIELSGR